MAEESKNDLTRSIRKSNRGVTMAPSSSKAPMVVRKLARSQTLPAAGSRRGDITLNESQLEFLKELQDKLRASTATCLTEAQLAEFSGSCLYCGVGDMGESSSVPFQQRDINQVVNGDISPKTVEDTCTVYCMKGSKGPKDCAPNQDNFSFSRTQSGLGVYCVLDGHGACGHFVSQRGARTLPYFLSQQIIPGADVEKSIKAAFESVRKDLIGFSIQQGFDIQASGSTCMCVIRLSSTPSVIWVAHVGDSRGIMFSQISGDLLFESRDHKPSNDEELKRVAEAGGEVRTFHYDDDFSVSRIFAKGADYPGLCMTRSLGDECVKSFGVIAEPEVKRVEVDLKRKPSFILASDGIWEFLSSDWVGKALALRLASEGGKKCLLKLAKEAARKWKVEEPDYCDDITGLILNLNTMP